MALHPPLGAYQEPRTMTAHTEGICVVAGIREMPLPSLHPPKQDTSQV